MRSRAILVITKPRLQETEKKTVRRGLYVIHASECILKFSKIEMTGTLNSFLIKSRVL